jgi:hypothetical protein
MHYYASSLFDGTITSAYPIRKPLPKIIKQDHIKIDEDGVCDEGWYDSGKGYSDVNIENRFRFQNIMANRLNTRRAIREIVMPELKKIHSEINIIHKQLDQIQSMIEIKGR